MSFHMSFKFIYTYDKLIFNIYCDLITISLRASLGGADAAITGCSGSMAGVPVKTGGPGLVLLAISLVILVTISDNCSLLLVLNNKCFL